MPTFTTTVWSGGGDTAGIRIPDEVMTALGGKRVPVVVTLDGAYSYRNTTAVMGGLNLVGISKEHRTASGVAVGDSIEVTLERDDAPREVEVPADLAETLAEDPVASAAWGALAYSRRRSTPGRSPRRRRMPPASVGWRRCSPPFVAPLPERSNRP